MYDHDVGSLVISRNRNPGAADLPNELEHEVYVPKCALAGILPECLLDEYSIWRTGNFTLRGYSSSSDTQLLVKVAQDGAALIYRSFVTCSNVLCKLI